MDWADFRMRLFRIVSLDIFDARDDFISTPEGMDAKWFFYKYCGAAGLNSDRWQSLVTLAKNLIKVDEEGLADAWAEWYRSGIRGGNSDLEGMKKSIADRFRDDEPDDDFLYQANSGVWFDFIAYLSDRDGWLAKYDKSHLPPLEQL